MQCRLSMLALIAACCLPGRVEAQPRSRVGYDQIVGVVIGIGDQGEPWGPLPNAVIDAERFADLLRGRGARVIELYDAEATEGAIVDAITIGAPAALRQPVESGARTLLVIYFVGHGHTRLGQGFLIPHGAARQSDWISMREIEGLAGQAAAFRHQIYILGTCFGGELLRSTSSTPAETRERELATWGDASIWRDRGLDKVARVGITAGGADDKVPDGLPGAGSRFGNAVVEALRPMAAGDAMAADFNRDHCVSHLELAAYVEGHGRSPHNSPRAGTLEGDDQGVIALCDRVFTRPTAVPAPVGATRGSDASSPALVRVKPGSFLMGSPVHEVGRHPSEGPQRLVHITRSLWVQAHEVTQAQWRAVMGTEPAFFGGCDPCPVERVNWFEAARYANALSAREGFEACYGLEGCGEGELGAGCAPSQHGCHRGTWRCEQVEFAGVDCRGYRLPTEAEWAYFTRAETAAGPSPTELYDVAWFSRNSGGRTRPVQGKRANPWGLFDVHGNVHEWCHDGWSPSYSAQPGFDPIGPEDGRERVLRGGSFSSDASDNRAAYRNGGWPAWRSRAVGVRLVRTVP